eukprot:CAMPEP_0178929152 /NCGR_PEP_ID=MMETSP0786-20121207/20389_1 /TAXON_ID=186022 /ORGANISM="Thalassionema frauenfeldii, Strain CCMP 1798" /LENGTH=205 /DNA_ID=CAMNT_0020605273 /DNA_START=152 /DNA_END=766 /DNA_ORIENTATION=+
MPPSSIENNGLEGDSKDQTYDSDPFAGLPPLKRPRKTVYKSTLQKRNREKRRREHFNEGLQQLSEIVFQNDPSILSGRDNQIDEDEPSTATITNRGELIGNAVDSMNLLINEVLDQKDTIAELEKSLATKKASKNLFLSQSCPSILQKTIEHVPSNRADPISALISFLPNGDSRSLELNRLINIGLTSHLAGTRDSYLSKAILRT